MSVTSCITSLDCWTIACFGSILFTSTVKNRSGSTCKVPSSYFIVFLISPSTAHRIVGYFEEEAVYSYTEYLNELDEGRIENVPAPRIAITYWNLADDARLRDVILAVRDDEAGHRDVNHYIATYGNVEVDKY